MAIKPGLCAACGKTADTHEHHLIPKVHGGLNGPTVNLCVPCHGLTHSRTWNPEHRTLTKAGLAALKAQGVELGNRTNLADAARKGADTVVRSADAHAANVLPSVRQMQAAGVKTLAELASGLNSRGIPTARGGQWHSTTIKRLLDR